MQDVVEEIADVETDDFAFPVVPVQIVDCGVISVKEPFHVNNPDELEKKAKKDKKSNKGSKKQ